MLNQNQIKGKWNEIKGGMRNIWGEITDDELEKFKGDLYSATGFIQKKFGESQEVIKEKLDRLMDSFDNKTDKSLKLNDGEASYERNPTSERIDTEDLEFDAGSDEDYDSDEIFDEENKAEDRITRH